MSTSDYFKYKSAIETANSNKDKDSLRLIQMQLIAQYGLSNDDVQTLIKKFKYTV